MAILTVENASKEFGGVHAVEKVSLQANTNEILSIIGPNGAGKTTLFNLITRIYDLTGGEINFNGKDITNIEQYKLAKLGMARTFQNIELFQDLTTLQNVMVGGYIHGKIGFFESMLGFRNLSEEKKLKEMAIEKIHQIGLEEYMDFEAVGLPYGRQRMVEVARALMTAPKILLLDEPAAGLNDQESEALQKLLISLKNSGICVILIEHDMKMVMSISDRIVVMNHGMKIAEGTPKEIQENPEVISAYLGEEVF